MQQGGKLGKSTDKSAVVGGLSKELSDLLNVGRSRPVPNGVQLTGNSTKFPITDNVTTKFQFGRCKNALGRFGVQLILMEQGEDPFKVLIVVIQHR